MAIIKNTRAKANKVAKFNAKLLSECPFCSSEIVSSSHLCGRKSAIFWAAFGIISTGQKQPDNKQVGVMIRVCKAPAEFELVAKAVMTNDKPTETSEKNIITPIISQ